MPRKSICLIAKKITKGARRSSYGPVEESSQAMADIFSVILRKKLKAKITPSEALLIMVGLKIIRETNKPQRDNRVDIVGYTELVDQIS